MTQKLVLARRDFLRLTGVTALGTVIAGCVPASPAGGGAVTGPKTDTSKLVVALPDLGKQEWRPWLSNSAEEQIRHMIGDTLIWSNPKTNALEPGIAESWSASPDGRIWTFKIRPNVQFQDGYGTVTAEDVKFSWDQYTQKDATTGSAMTVMLAATEGSLANFEITGPLEFRVKTTKSPSVFLPALLANAFPGMAIQSKKYWTEKPNEAVVHPLGTGPYKFISSTPGVEVKLEAMPGPHLWRKTSAFKSITIIQITDVGARLAQVQSGAVDLAVVTPAIGREAAKSGVTVLSVKEIGNMAVMLGGQYSVPDPKFPNVWDRKSPWIQADTPDKGLAIRQAMSAAIDRKTIIDKVLNGGGQLAYGPHIQYDRPQLIDPSWKLPEYNVATAKQLLATGGYPTGFDVTVPMFENRPGTGGADVAEAIAGMWEAIGLKVKRQVIDFTAFRPTLMTRTTAGMAFPYLSPYQDEGGQAFGSYTPGSTFGIYYDQDMLDGVAKASVEPDRNKRFEISRAIIGSLIKSVKAIPLFTIDQSYIASAKVGGWTPLAGDSLVNGVETITPKVP